MLETSNPYFSHRHCAPLWEVRVTTLIAAQARFEAWRGKKLRARPVLARQGGRARVGWMYYVVPLHDRKKSDIITGLL